MQSLKNINIFPPCCKSFTVTTTYNVFGVNLGEKKKLCVSFYNFSRKWQNRILKWEKNCFIFSTFDNFCLLSVAFLHAVAFSRMTVKRWSQVTATINKCVGLQHSETKLPSWKKELLNNAENSSRNLSEKNSPSRLTYLTFIKSKTHKEISPIWTGIRRIPIQWKICLSRALTSYADFCDLHTNKEKNANRDTDLGQEREEGDRWLDGLTLRSFQTSKLKTLRCRGTNHAMRSRDQHAL